MAQRKTGDDGPGGGPLGRIHAFLSGRVQGVGMRATVLHLAEREALTGWVRNLPDGRVELAAEGEMEALNSFLQRLEPLRYTYIEGLQVTWESPTGQSESFSIVY